MKNFLGTGLGRQQGAGTGSLYVAGSFAISGLLTLVFLSLPERFLSGRDYGGLGVLWTATFLTVQVVWIGVSQTLGRYVAEREARGEDAEPVVRSVRRVALLLVGAVLVVGLAASPFLREAVFGGSTLLTAAFLAAVVAYAPEYLRRGTFSGHRQFARLGALHVAESSSRMLLGTALLVAGFGLGGPALAIVVAPLVGVLAVRPIQEKKAAKPGTPFSAVQAFRFVAPVLACVAFGQTIMNGGTILISVLGGPEAQARAGAFFAALVLMRAPQYVMSPAIAALLPHASRTLASEGVRGLDRFILRAGAVVALVGLGMVVGAALLGEWVMSIIFARLQAETGVLVALASLAAFYLVSETVSQALFALGRPHLAALGWFTGLPVCAAVLLSLNGDLVDRVSISLAAGAAATAAAQTALYILARRTGEPGPLST